MTKEQKFYDALKDIFVGAKVEGESGYINLMRIKSRYYEKGVLPKLEDDVEEELKPFPEFREELFDKLYTFFSRYFSESGSIYFTHTPIYQNVYEKVYTDDKDVILFWKTRPLYYVKTDRIFNSMPVEFDGYKFYFDASRLEYKKANEKKEIVYEFKRKREDGTIVFEVFYTERGKKTKIDEILKALKKAEVRMGEDTLERAFRIFERQSEVDYFINQNAREFLKEQFDIWLYQYVFSGESQWTEERIKQLQVLKDTASKIIDFIAQFEDELVRIWNKPKVVLNSNYVITLDKVADRSLDLIEKILNHKNFDEQVKEWRELGIVDESFNPSIILSGSEESRTLIPKYNHLPIDTKYFKNLELEILGLFDDLDNALDGWLVRSENYQALNTILPKFKEKVQTIYIDPPYNTEKDSFSYSDKFNQASWTTMMENRLSIAKDFLSDEGSIYVHVDFHETASMRFLLDSIFGKDNFLNEIIWRIGWLSGFKTAGDKYVRNHETIWLYKKSPKCIFNREAIQVPYETFKLGEKRDEFLKALKSQLGIKAGKFRLALIDEKGKVYKPESRGDIRKGFYPLEDIWNASEYDELNSIMIMSFTNEKVGDFLTQKPEKLLKRIIKASSKESNTDIALDFFLGTGTTTAVAHKLGKNWIGIELDRGIFYEKALPRMKEILASRGNHEPCGISKEVNWQGGGFFKYYELEQYEDALRKVRYEDSDLFENPYEDPYSQYVFMRDIKMLEALEIDYENNKVKVDLSKLYENIDIPETLSNLSGKWIKRITPDEVELENGETIDIKNLDYKLIKPLIWW